MLVESKRNEIQCAINIGYKLNTGLLNCTRFDIYDNFFLSQESSCNRRLAIHRRESALREAAATSTLSTTVPEISTSSTTGSNSPMLM